MIVRILLVGDRHDFEQLLVRRLNNEVNQLRLAFAETMTVVQREMGRELNHIIIDERMSEQVFDTINRLRHEQQIYAKVHVLDPLDQVQVEALINGLKQSHC